MRQNFVFLLFVQFYTTVWCQCRFTLSQVQTETRVAAINRNGEFELLNEDIINPGEIIHYFCSSTDVIPVMCLTNNQFNDTLPTQPNCTNTPKAIVEPTSDVGCKVRSFQVGYRLGSIFLEVYRSCFDDAKLFPLNTSHIAYPYSLVTQRPEQGFTNDKCITTKQASAYGARSYFVKFNALLGCQQTYIQSERDLKIDRGHLTPSGDYLFPMTMGATFKYINVIPQFSAINKGIWKSVENTVRRIVNSYGKTLVTTGAFGVLELNNGNNRPVKMYLEGSNQIPIPKWIYKIVKSPASTVVFLTYNNSTAPQLSPICTVVPCPNGLEEKAKPGYTVCCEPNNFENKVIPRMRR